MSEYSTKLRDPRWQKKRLEILQRDEWACQICFDTTATLMVHHFFYEREREPWDYPNDALITLCEPCHEDQHQGSYEAERQIISTLRSLHAFNSELFDVWHCLCEFKRPLYNEQWSVFTFHLMNLVRAFGDEEMYRKLCEEWHENVKKTGFKFKPDEPKQQGK